MRSVPTPDVAVGIVLMMVMALLPCALAARADEIHVPADFPTIQAAINTAVDGDQVVIADGVYSGAGNRDLNFQGKAITVRSENGPDNCILDLGENRGFLFFNGETNASVLDGLTVRNAFHQTFQPDLLRGGAIFIEDASPSISNCIFADNDLDSNGFVAFGGAIYSSGDPILTNCVFDTNSIFGGSIASGGAFYNDGGNPQFFDCHFQNNSSNSWPAGAAAFGGAIGGEGSVTLTRCTFVDNHVLGDELNSTGGAVATDRAMLIDCHFEGNRASSQGPAEGGAIAVTDESSQVINCSFFNNDAISCCVPAEGGAMSGPGTLLSCLFVGNTGDRGGGYSGAGSVLNCTFVANEAGLGAAIDGAAQVSNSIAWNNIGDPFNGPEVTYSNIQGGDDGEGNIDADPLFVDPNNGDYRLSAGSPSIDAGSNDAVACAMFDLDGNERFADDPRTRDTGLGRSPIVDMGAYEFGSPQAAGGDDCNRNGLDDACELAAGFAADCNDNGVPDSCDIAVGISEDCNLDGAPDECSDDCNNNGLPDVCEVVSAFTVTSDEMSPVMGGLGLEFLISMPPEALTDVTMTFVALADLDTLTRFINVRLNDVLLGTVFGVDGFECDDVSIDTLVVSADTFNDLANGGDALLTMTPSDNVDPCGPGFLIVSVEYLMPDPDTDADGNGIPDECETLGDLDGDGVVGSNDLLALLGAWGSCDDCDNCAADLDGDCSVGTADLIILLGNWG